MNYIGEMKSAAIINTCFRTVFVFFFFQQAACQKVKVTFYYISLVSWNEHSCTATLKSTLSNKANSYCPNNLGSCGLMEWLPSAIFRTTDVVIVDGYPAQLKSNIVVELSIWMNPLMNRSDPKQNYLPVNALKAILRNSRSSLQSDTDSWIIYLDEDHISPPPPARSNEILIPVAFAIVIAIVIIAVALHCWREQKDASERIMAKKTSGKSRVSPKHHQSSSNGDKSILQMVNTPSRAKLKQLDRSNDVTATPSGISMTADVTDGTKFESVDEGKRRHKKRRKKKKHHDEAPDKQTDKDDNCHRFADREEIVFNDNGGTHRANGGF